MKLKLNFCLTLLSVILFLSACHNEQKDQKGVNSEAVSNPATASGDKKETKQPEFKFEREKFDFGKITEGEKVSYAFKFTNSGNANLVISEAHGSCGCTIPEYPKEPIAPGKTGIINVTFNSEGKKGDQHKTVTITANTVPNTKVLDIMGMVEAK